MKRSLVAGIIAVIASSAAIADAPRLRSRGAATQTHRAVAQTHRDVAPNPHRSQHSHHGPRPLVVVRYVPAFQVATPYPNSLSRPAADPAPYFIVRASPTAREIMTFAETEPARNWNWTRVDSLTALVPRKVHGEDPSR